MRKFVIFTEGQSELILVRRLIPLLFGWGSIQYECVKLIGDATRPVNHKFSSANPELYFLILNVENDSRVLSEIYHREEKLFNEGYEAVIGLRDMYCKEYEDLTNKIDNIISNKFIQKHQSIINGMSHPEQIYIFFEIMEFEAWILSMFTLLPKVDNRLTISYIEDNYHVNLRDIDPETAFFHPANKLQDIFNLVGIKYNKSESIIESILSRIDCDDLLYATENGRCHSLQLFLEKLESIPQAS
jgi:hypothetical protein